jgi:hypothetical protein
VVAIGFAEGEALVGQLLGLLPSACPEAVKTQQHECVDSRGDGTAFPAVTDSPPQGLMTARQPVHVDGGDAGPHDRGRVGLVAQAADRGVDLAECRDRGAGRVGKGLALQGQNRRNIRPEPGDRGIERVPQLGAPAEEAHQQQSMECLDEHAVAGVARLGPGFDRAGQQAVRSVDVAVPVEQEVGGRDRCLQRPAELGVGPAGVGEELRHAAKFSGHVSADVGSLGDPAAAVGAERAHLGGSQQRGDSADGVTAPPDPARDLLEQAG